MTKILCGNREKAKYIDGIWDLTVPREAGLAKSWARDAGHEEPRKVPFLIILSDGCYTQFPVRILPPTSCMLAGVRLAVIGSDLHRGDETILNFATVC